MLFYVENTLRCFLLFYIHQTLTVNTLVCVIDLHRRSEPVNIGAGSFIASLNHTRASLLSVTVNKQCLSIINKIF